MRSTARRRTMSPVPEDTISFWLGAYAERVLTARGDERRLKRVFFTSPLPMVLVDDERRYADANIPARLALRLSRGEIRQRRAGDLAPPDLVPVLDESWRRMLETGCVAGRSDVASPPGSSMEITYYSVANALPGLHLSVFLPRTGRHRSSPPTLASSGWSPIGR